MDVVSPFFFFLKRSELLVARWKKRLILYGRMECNDGKFHYDLKTMTGGRRGSKGPYYEYEL